jgi:alpha-galactosidase
MKWNAVWMAACLSTAMSVLSERPARVNYTDPRMNPTEEKSQDAPTAFAAKFTQKLDSDGLPPKEAWDKASPLQYEWDWTGLNPDPQRRTELSLRWTPETLFLRFRCRYKTITVFPDAREDGWRDKLWDRDVAETFLQPDATDPFVYTEFEVSPNGHWIDLAVAHGKIQELHSGLRRRVVLDEKSRIWTAELAIPMKSLTPNFDPHHSWRVNFFRIEGADEPRFYSAWSPTHSPKPNFHVPSAFRTLVFGEYPQ